MKNKSILKVISSLTLVSMMCYTLPVMAYTKEETIYSKLDASGKQYQTIVSSHIKNTDAQTTLKDISDLLNIENTNGYETFEKDGNTLLWNANGNDIYYKGETKKELPVSCNIKYELDGKQISKDEIAGRSGKVKMTLEYTNNEKHIVNINGKNETMYTPFLVIAGTIINNETNKNITISSGKVIDDGSKTIAVGMAFPGMQESLGIKEKNFELPTKIEITMDTTDFELDTIASFITSKIIESKDDLAKLDKLDKVYEKVVTLQSASEEILNGAKTLKEGTEEYSSKKQEFNTAMKQVSTGMTSANKSYQELDNGINTLNKSSKTLGNGAKQISDGTSQVSSNLEVIATKLSEAEQGSKKLEQGEAQIAEGLKQISSGIKLEDSSEIVKNLKTIIKQNQDTIDTLTKTNKALNAQLTNENASIIKPQIEANTKMIALLTANKTAQEETLKTLSKTSEQISKLEGGIKQLQTGISSLQVGNKDLTTGITQLKEGTITLAGKSKELTSGAKSLYKGTQDLSKGTSELSQGSSKMKQGLNTLDTSTAKLTVADDALTTGAITIKDGANTLYEGIFKFNEEGIKPICNLINGNVKNITKRVKKLGELSLEYNNYTMLEEGEEGSVQFILLTDAIKGESKQKQNGEDVILNENDIKYNKEEK